MTKPRKKIGISIDEIIIYLTENGFTVRQEFKANGSSWGILKNEKVIYKNLTLSDLTYVVLKSMNSGTFYTPN